MKTFKIALVAAAVVASGSVMAASDGGLGTSSTGSSVVTIIKDNAVQITNVADLDLGQHSALAADETASDPVCVFSSTSGYNVTATSTNGAFNLSDGANNIPYTLEWSANGGTAVALGYNTALTGLTGDSASLTCGAAGTNAEFSATIAAAAFNAADPGTYTDTVSLLIQPE